MRLIAFPQWAKLTSLLRGMARRSAADYAQRSSYCVSQLWSKDCNMKSSLQFPCDLVAMLEMSYQLEPWDAELLYESGNISLFADETTEDAAVNKSDEEIWWRNSLFLKRRKIDGTAGSRESSDRWNVFALKTIAAKLGTSVVFGVLCGIIAPVV